MDISLKLYHGLYSITVESIAIYREGSNGTGQDRDIYSLAN